MVVPTVAQTTQDDGWGRHSRNACRGWVLFSGVAGRMGTTGRPSHHAVPQSAGRGAHM